MNGIETAVARGQEASGSRFEPVTVEHRGWMVAVVRDKQTGNQEKIYEQCGQWYFTGVGQTASGEYTVHRVRSRELRRIGRAMLRGEHRDDMVREAFAARAARNGDGGGRRRVRRGKA